MIGLIKLRERGASLSLPPHRFPDHNTNRALALIVAGVDAVKAQMLFDEGGKVLDVPVQCQAVFLDQFE
jgi:hypothetical protein